MTDTYSEPFDGEPHLKSAVATAAPRPAWMIAIATAGRGSGPVLCFVATALADAAAFTAADILVLAVLQGLGLAASGPLMALTAVVAILLRAACGLYPGYRLTHEEVVRRRVLTALVAGATATVAGVLLIGVGADAVVAVAALLVLAGVLAIVLDTAVCRGLRRLEIWGTPVEIAASPDRAAAVAAFLRANWRCGLVPAANGRAAATLILAGDTLPSTGEVRRLRSAYDEVIVLADLPRLRLAGLQPGDLKSEIGLRLAGRPAHAYPGKRLCDLAIAIPAAVLAAPLVLLAAVGIAIVDPGPVFYRQTREGLGGRPIRVLKLRTMYRDAEAILDGLLARDPAARAEWMMHFKLRRDPRVLPVVGHLLRASSLDELPQLLNVIAGDMSIVGPRPFPDYHLAAMRPDFRAKRATVVPGLTGLWQISDRSDADVATQELLDEYYIDNTDFWFDISIILRTFASLLRLRGV
ncbi:sugar transferase [Acuticoccus sediminis]|uniref:sugar transferase n=1 Tax=Acuticoccus sediminis TaxID=2184697 RepID=UPI00299F2BB1|nr:sugar transferase [Acuticoccus sediminis]